MDVPALIRQALVSLRTNQAGLARKLERGEPTVSRWISGSGKPDYESCLRLAQITGKAPREVLETVGLDPTLLPVGDSDSLTPIQRDVLTRALRIQAAVDAAEGVPDGFVETYLRTVLDNTESEITAAIELVRQHRQVVPQAPLAAVAPTTRRQRVTKRRDTFGRPNDEEVLQDNTIVVAHKKTYPSWQYKSQSVETMAAEFGRVLV